MGRRLFIAEFPRYVTEDCMLVLLMAINEWFQEHDPVVDARRLSIFFIESPAVSPRQTCSPIYRWLEQATCFGTAFCLIVSFV